MEGGANASLFHVFSLYSLMQLQPGWGCHLTLLSLALFSLKKKPLLCYFLKQTPGSSPWEARLVPIYQLQLLPCHYLCSLCPKLLRLQEPPVTCHLLELHHYWQMNPRHPSG
uniref:ATX3 n=1 Tax=Arundo donax TaxID=35708 RepID=A0A0A9E292_ARUDO